MGRLAAESAVGTARLHAFDKRRSPVTNGRVAPPQVLHHRHSGQSKSRPSDALVGPQPECECDCALGRVIRGAPLS